jgi:DNA-binding MarR family transcriptional regulator
MGKSNQTGTQLDLVKLLEKLFLTTTQIESRVLAVRTKNDLTLSEYHILGEIKKGDRRTMTEIAAALHISRSALTTAINKLEKKSCVRRERTEANRRVVYLHLLPKGEKLFKDMEKYHERIILQALANVEPVEEPVFMETIIRIDNFFTSVWNDPSLSE